MTALLRADPEQTPKVDPGAEMVPNRATMEEYERLKKMEELETKGPKQIQQTADESRELQTGGPGVGETASEPASDEAAETAESPEEKTRTEAELLDALTVLEMNPLRDREARPLPRIDASPIEEEGMVRNLVTGPAGIDPLASLGPSAIESAKRLLDYPTYEVPFKELSPKEYRNLSRDEKRAYNDALDEYRFSGPEVRGAFPFRSTVVDAGPSAAEERREALQPELERRRQENTEEYPNREPASSAPVDPRLEAALGLRPMTDMERVEMLRRGVSANAQRERDAILADQARRAAAAQAAGVSGIPYRQAMGGKNPSTAKLMKRIKAKYGMK